MRTPDGRFGAGPDPDRHVLTTEERRRGYRHACRAGETTGRCADAAVLAWAWRRVRAYYRRRRART